MLEKSSMEKEAGHSVEALYLSVSDTGAGIPKEKQAHIFDRFYRGDKSRSQTGIGLGLSQVKAFVEFLKGNICVTSTPNKGSIFTVSMPY